MIRSGKYGMDDAWRRKITHTEFVFALSTLCCVRWLLLANAPVYKKTICLCFFFFFILCDHALALTGLHLHRVSTRRWLERENATWKTEHDTQRIRFCPFDPPLYLWLGQR